jgi:3-deoxy-7-phosphoheptulonate synthase
VRTFTDHSRFTLDISAVPELKRITHLPVVVDPSHASGKRFMVGPMARAAVAAGADGIMIEIHPEPGKALCDGAHSLTLDMFAELMGQIETTASAIGRQITRI